MDETLHKALLLARVLGVTLDWLADGRQGWPIAEGAEEALGHVSGRPDHG